MVMTRSSCGACHEIPGVSEADGLVGPPLTHFAQRTMIAGFLPNTPDNLERWVQHPQAVAPGNAMPDLGLSDRDARDVAAYLDRIR
jgi:cytochrome c1